MQLDESRLASSSSVEIMARFFVPVTIVVIALILVYVLYRWKLGYDKRAIENLKSEKLRLQMEALAAEKKALRKVNEEKKQAMKVEPPKITPIKKDEVGDEEILQF